jgi:glutamate---cysteine ligase / carboxylate-amine ligase
VSEPVTDPEPQHSGLDLEEVRAVFESSTDFTIGLEEEFALLDPDTLSLSNLFEELRAEADDDDLLADSLVGELIASEVEIRSGKGEDFRDALERQHERRRRLFALAESRGVALGATGTHPWSPWQEQRIIDTPHYRLVEEKLKYVAWRNNTFSNHVHVGVRGADRAVAVCDALRPVLPVLLAASANSPWAEARLSGLHSTRTEIFTRMFPRCGIPDHFGGWGVYAAYVDFLFQTRSIDEHTEIWWSVRPHLAYGTVEIRIMDAQSCAGESTALLALATACAAQAALDYDAGRMAAAPPNRLIEENFWRAIRHGLDGKLIDLDATAEIPAPTAVERLLAWTTDARAELSLDEHLGDLGSLLSNGNGSQRQRRRANDGEPIADVYAATVADTRATYATAGAAMAAPCGEATR